MGNKLAKKSLICGYTGIIIISIFVAYAFQWRLGLAVFVIMMGVFSILISGYLSKGKHQDKVKTIFNENREAINRISADITNSIVACTPFDDETFNRVINDIRLIIMNSLNGCDLNDPVQIKNTVSYLKDVRSYLIYLQALYVKKPQAVKIINNLIDDINDIKDIKIDEN
jgi:hypothetical protein